MASSHLEMTLYVIAPRFRHDSLVHSITFGPGYGWAAGSWKVNLKRTDEGDLWIGVNWNREYGQPFTNFHSMRIIPRSNFFRIVSTVQLDWKDPNPPHAVNHSTKTIVPGKSVLEGDNYNFTIVFSTEPELLRLFFTQLPMPTPVSTVTSTAVSKERELISLLLKDPNSVDVCFTFPTDKSHANIGLWAHTFLLSQHESFAELIQDARTAQSLEGIALSEKQSDVAGNGGGYVDSDSFSNHSVHSMDTATGIRGGTSSVGAASRAPLVIKVDTVSLATFCVMLYYIYTGKIDLSVDTSRFVLSDTSKATLVWRNSAGKVEDTVDWHPLDQDSPWRLKDVAWKELKDAAAQYSLKDLQTLAEQGLQSHR
ncbi:hypothetical protein BGW39_005308 [Mortierella sp. 14UC]|nr:hypothetical protein BGW39_005308 [Mortierella sp. 14UC]